VFELRYIAVDDGGFFVFPSCRRDAMPIAVSVFAMQNAQ
jgi:hypothetical protein